jgi:hypothetical protein
MPPSSSNRRAATQPADLCASIQEAINNADVEAIVDAHDERATIVVPSEGGIASGRTETLMREALALRSRPVWRGRYPVVNGRLSAERLRRRGRRDVQA